MAEIGIKTRHHSALEVFPEPAARIQRIDLARQGMADRPGTVGRAVKRFVVKDIQHAIRALAHIKLDIVRTLLQGEIGGGKGVFGRKMVGAAMRDDFGHGMSCQFTGSG